jgi:formate C-acetyltransferase
MGDDGRPLVTKTSFRFLQTLYNLGPAPEPNMTILYTPQLPEAFRRFAAKVAIDTSSIQFESDEIIRRAWGDDGAIACCVSPMLIGKQMQFFGARANLAKCLLYAYIYGGTRREISAAVAPSTGAVEGEQPLEFEEYVLQRFVANDGTGSPGVSVNAMNVIHYMQDTYAYERIEMARTRLLAAADDGVRHGGLSVVADSLSAIKHSEVRVIRDQTGLVTDYADRRRVPDVREQRQPRGTSRPGSSADSWPSCARGTDVPEAGCTPSRS